jgi:hypothetical protein
MIRCDTSWVEDELEPGSSWARATWIQRPLRKTHWAPGIGAMVGASGVFLGASGSTRSTGGAPAPGWALGGCAAKRAGEGVDGGAGAGSGAGVGAGASPLGLLSSLIVSKSLCPLGWAGRGVSLASNFLGSMLVPGGRMPFSSSVNCTWRMTYT